MEVKIPPEVLFVWVGHDIERSHELAPALGAAVHDTELLFDEADTSTLYRKLFICEEMSPTLPNDWLWVPAERAWLEGLMGGPRRSISNRRRSYPISPESLARATAELLADAPLAGFSRQPLLVITDMELMPPEDWRYLLADECAEGYVASVAPLDPEYWSEQAPRAETVQRRLRALCCSNLGDIFGVNGCRQPGCLFLDPIDTVLQLDLMVGICDAHQDSVLARIVGKGFGDLEGVVPVKIEAEEA